MFVPSTKVHFQVDYWAGFCGVALALIIAVFRKLDGNSVDTDSRPVQGTSSFALIYRLLCLLWYSARSGGALLDGVLPLRYCSTWFDARTPTWRLLPLGGVPSLATQGGRRLGLLMLAHMQVLLLVPRSRLEEPGALELEDVDGSGRESD